MVSLEKSASRMHYYSIGRTIYDIYTNDETRKRWAKAYIKKLEEHMLNKDGDGNGKVMPFERGINSGWVAATKEMLKFLKGENEK